MCDVDSLIHTGDHGACTPCTHKLAPLGIYHDNLIKFSHVLLAILAIVPSNNNIPQYIVCRHGNL